MKRGNVLLVTTILALFAASLFWMTRSSGEQELSINSQQVKQQLLKITPLGSSIQQAQAALQKIGFQCSTVSGGDFTHIDSETGIITKHPNINFLECYKKQPHFLQTRWWDVAVIDRQGCVSDILVNSGESYGPVNPG